MSNERCEGICRCEGLSDEGKFFARVLRTFDQYATPVAVVEDPREVFTLVEDPRACTLATIVAFANHFALTPVDAQ